MALYNPPCSSPTQDAGSPGPARHCELIWIVEREARREHALGVVIAVQRQADLLQVVLAVGASSRLAGRLDGGRTSADQEADDGDDHQQFDEGEASILGRSGTDVACQASIPSGSGRTGRAVGIIIRTPVDSNPMSNPNLADRL